MTNRFKILLHADRHLARIAYLCGGLSDALIMKRVRIHEAMAYGPDVFNRHARDRETKALRK